MPASAGTPTILQKVAARFGFGHAIGMTDAEIKATLEGEARDLNKGEQDLIMLFAPILHTAETQGLADAQAFATDLLKSAPSITSVAQAVDLVKAGLSTQTGAAKTQFAALGQTAFTTFVSAVLASLGHLDLPAA